MSRLIAAPRGALKRATVLVTAALVLALAPGTAAAADKGTITCTPSVDGIGINYTSTPFGAPGSQLVSLNGDWSANLSYVPCVSSRGGFTGDGFMGVHGYFGGALAAAPLGCPSDLLQGTLTFTDGWLIMGESDIALRSMEWRLAAHEIVISGSGVDQRGNPVTISGSAQYIVNPGDCKSWMLVTYAYVVLNATW